jgi:hypothetical protein
VRRDHLYADIFVSIVQNVDKHVGLNFDRTETKEIGSERRRSTFDWRETLLSVEIDHTTYL